MKIIVIAAIAPGGVIGRSYKPCLVCMRSGIVAGPGEYTTERCTACENGSVPCNELPWSPGTYPEDMEHFKTVTLGHAVVMGRNTWESIPAKFRPLPGRSNHVVSSRDVGVGAWRCACLADAIIGADGQGHEKLYVIGGARLYAEALPIADELDLTLVSKKWDGDVLFPKLEAGFDHTKLRATFGPFECVSSEPCPTNPDLTFTRWVRR